MVTVDTFFFFCSVPLLTKKKIEISTAHYYMRKFYKIALPRESRKQIDQS